MAPARAGHRGRAGARSRSRPRRSRAPTTRRWSGSRTRSRCSRESASRATCCRTWASARSCTPGRRSSWDDMSGPLRGAVIGAAVYEGLAERPRGRRAPGRLRRVRVRAVPRARRGRADGGRRQRLDADVRGRERRRTATARSARSTRGSARCCATAPTTTRCSTGWRGSATCSRACSPARWPAGRADRPARDDRPGAPDGRRGPQPQPRRRRRCCSARCSRR